MKNKHDVLSLPLRPKATAEAAQIAGLFELISLRKTSEEEKMLQPKDKLGSKSLILHELETPTTKVTHFNCLYN